MLLAKAKAMALCHEMISDAKIGPFPNISLVYPASCKLEDNLSAQNLNAIRNWLYLDMVVFSRHLHRTCRTWKRRNSLSFFRSC